MTNVKVIAHTVPTDAEFGKNISEYVAYVARVSNPANQHNHETAQKLLNYLERNKHFSPFEMANIVLEVNTTRDIARQLLRHRSFTFQEFSQRYALAGEFVEPKTARLQDSKNRQNSLETTDQALIDEWNRRQQEVIDLVQTHYNWAIENDIAKEVARVILPEGLTKSRLYLNGTLRSIMHYIAVRTDPSTQLEHRELALEIAKAVEPIIGQSNS